MLSAAKDPQTDVGFHTRIPANRPLSPWFALLGALTSIGLLATIGFFYLGGFGDEAFWTDETATFWQSELAYPLTERGISGIQAMFNSVRGGSADPGGFNVLLLAWINFFGASVESLRTFAFSFFLLYLGFIAVLTRWLALPALVGSAVIAVMLLENITPYYAFELRPYMPELAASMGFLVLALFLLEHSSVLSLTVFVIGTVLLGASQYSSAVLSISVGILLVIIYARSARESRSFILLAAALVSLFWPVLQYALLRGIPLMTGQAPPTHTTDLLMRNQDFNQIVETLSINILAPTALPRTVFLIAIPLLWLFGKQILERRFTQPARNAVGIMWLYVLLGTTFSALLSLLGVMPWTLGTRWSINEVGFIAVSLVGLTFIGFELIADRLNSRISQFVLAVICVSAVFVGSFRIATYSRPSSVDYLSPLSVDLFSGSTDGLIIDNWIVDDIRYLIEYSGRYDGLKDAWFSMAPRNSLGYEAATEADVTAFLEDASADRLLLRNLEPLRTIELPNGVTVLDPFSSANSPVLLIKNSPGDMATTSAN